MVAPLFQSDFLFLRHGRTALNAADRVAGSTDVELDELGHAQALAARDALAAEALAAIWVSPLLRARQTAAAVAAARGLTPAILPDLAERDWGAWEGMPRAGLDRDATPPGGEAPAIFISRVLGALSRIEGPFPALIVAHSGVARVLAAALCPARRLRRPENGEAVRWQRLEGGGWRPVSISFPELPVLSPN
ncbi:histidine phosphatase family protein [Halovulum dunhuangense]|uniref:Histidine phosphatase family protein n=1 Tax=Halovulum dunhuangense TaxID=1505036 RepID=A0A849L6Q3_9RHOB|nr:histidine phosphatase family protein [Halovulum dunhuangense]NNU81822.1 histidine phosphatase family protein [Halovulum dunhuangense]